MQIHKNFVKTLFRKGIIMPILLLVILVSACQTGEEAIKESNAPTEQAEAVVEVQIPEDAVKIDDYYVQDGDTLKILYDGEWQLLRLANVECFEIKADDRNSEHAEKFGISLEEATAKGFEATAFVEKVVSRSEHLYVVFEDERGAYGRLLGVVYLDDGRILYEVIIENGFGWLYED